MRKNKFSSAADRRWQRRYERIQQRKEYEQYRKELREQEEFDQILNVIRPQYIHDMDVHPWVNQQISSPTFTVTLPRFDEPNRNGTVIPRDTWETAMEEYVETAVDTTQRSIADSILRIAHGDADESDRERVITYIREALEGRRNGQPSRLDQVREAFQRYTESWFESFVDVKDIGLGDRSIFSFDMSLAPDIQEAELDTGDTDILDSFLGEFLLQGTYSLCLE